MKEKFNQWMRSLRIWLSRRHGQDSLNNFLFVLYIIFALTTFGLVNIFGRSGYTDILRTLSFVIILLAILRFYSPKSYRRRQENFTYLNLKNKVLSRFRKQPSNDPYRYFTCKRCKQKLRVPKGKGKVEITSPKCGLKFDKKT